jgi:hypothetical protein
VPPEDTFTEPATTFAPCGTTFGSGTGGAACNSKHHNKLKTINNHDRFEFAKVIELFIYAKKGC